MTSPVVHVRGRRAEFALLVLVLVVAVRLRLPYVQAPPFGFAPMRQHHGAIIARAFYLRAHPDAATAERRRAAEDYVAQATVVEPPILERMAAMGYALIGGEDVRLPRALSAGFWILGALCLYAATRRVGDPVSALVAAIAFLSLPATFQASVSIQPDPLAMFWTCAALLVLLRWDETPTLRMTVVAATLTSPSVLIRPVTVCILYALLLALVWRRRAEGLSRWRAAGLLIAVSLAPAAAYYLYTLMTQIGTQRTVPALFSQVVLLSGTFWRGWADLVDRAFGLPLFIGAAVGGVALARGRFRAVMIGLWGGYVLYALAFPLHVSTHPYYQMMAVPVVALSAGAILQRLATPLPEWARAGVVIAALALFVLVPARTGLPTPGDRALMGEYEAIGRSVGHSLHTLFVAPYWGVPLRYYGDVGGRYWPSRFEVDMYRPLGEGGIPDIPALRRVEQLASQIGGVDYIIVADLPELERQPDLASFLAERGRLEASGERWRVYRVSDPRTAR